MAANIEIVRHLEATARYLRATPSSDGMMIWRLFDPDHRVDAAGQPLTHQIFLSPAIMPLLDQQALEVIKKIKANNLSAFKDYSIETNMRQIRELLLEEIRRLFLNDDGTIKQEYIDAFAYEVDGKMVSGEEAIKSQFSGVTIAAEGLPEINGEEESVKKFGYCLMSSYLSHCEQYLSECVSKEIGANEAHLPALDVWHLKEVRQRQTLIDHYNTDRLSSKKEPKKRASSKSIPSLSSPVGPSDNSRLKSRPQRPKAFTAPDLRTSKKHPWSGYTCERMPAGKVEELKPNVMYIKQMMTGGLVCYYMKEGQRVTLKVSKEEVNQFSTGMRAQLQAMAREDNINTIKTSNFIESQQFSSFDSAAFLNELFAIHSTLIKTAAVHYEEPVDLANDMEEYDRKTLMPSFKHNFRRVGRNFFKVVGYDCIGEDKYKPQHAPINQATNDEIQAICEDVNKSSSLFDMFGNAMREDNLASLDMVSLYQLREKLKELHEKISLLNSKKRPEYDNKPLAWALFDSSLDILMRMERIVYEEMRNRLIKNGMPEKQAEELFQKTEDEFFSDIINQCVPQGSIAESNFLKALNFLKEENIISVQQYVFILEVSNRDQNIKEQLVAIVERKGIIDLNRVAPAFITSLRIAPKETELRQKLVDLFTQGMLNEDDFIRGCAYLNRPQLVDAIVFSLQSTAEAQKNKVLSLFNEGKLTEGKCVFIYRKIQENLNVAEALIRAIDIEGHNELLNKLIQKKISDQEYIYICECLLQGTKDSIDAIIVQYRDKKLQSVSIDSISEIEADAEASIAVSREHLRTVVAATNPNPYSEPNPRAFVDPFMPIQGFSVELQLKAREDFIDLYNSMVDFHNDDKHFALYQQNLEEYIVELCVLKQGEKPTPAIIRQRHDDFFEKMYRYIFDEQGNYTQYFQREYSGKSVDQYLAHCQLSRQDLFLQYVQNYHDTVNELFRQHAVNLDSSFAMLFNTFHTEFFGRDQATAPNSIACDAFFCDKLREQINQDGWLASLDLMALFQLKKEVAALRGMSLEEKEALIYKIKIEQWKQLLVLKEWANVLPDDSKKTLGMIASEEDEYTYLNDILDFHVEQKPEVPGLKELAVLFREKRIEKDAFKFIFRQFSLNPDFAVAMVNAALEGISPVHYAARENDIELAQFLLNQGKSPQSSQDDKSRAPLHYAIQQSNMDMAELLVVKGADVNARDFLGKTPLHYAIEQGNLKAIQFLLMKGADPGIKDNSQRMAFHYALERKEKIIVDLIVNFVDKNYKTSLHYAVLEGDVELARHLIEQGAVMDSEDTEGKAPLHYAVINGNIQLAEHLIQHGADVDFEDTEGKTPLHYAVINGNIQLAQYLIQQGADVDFKDNDGKGPLHYAVEKNNEKLISLLIDGGANIEAQDKDGNTPLHDAAKKDNEKIFYLLFNRSVQFKSASVKRAAEALSAENANEKSAYISQRLALIPVNIPVVQNNEGKTPFDCAGGNIRRMESGRTLIRNYNRFLGEFSLDSQNPPEVFEKLRQRFQDNVHRVRQIMPSDQDSQELLERCFDLSGSLQYDSSYYRDRSSDKDHLLSYGEALLLESLVEALSIRASDDFKKMPQYQYLHKMLALKKEMSIDAAQNRNVTRRKALLAQMVNFDRTVRDSGFSISDQNEAYAGVNTKLKAPVLSSESTKINSSSFVRKRIAGTFMMALGSMMRMSSVGVSAISYGEKLIKESQTDSAKAKIQKSSVELLESAYHIKTEALSLVTGTVAEKCTTVSSKISVVWEDTPSNMKAVTFSRSEEGSVRLSHRERIEDLDTEEMLRPEHSMNLAERRKSEDFIGAGPSLDQGYRLRAISGREGKEKEKERADDKTIYFEMVNGHLKYSIMLAPEEWFEGTLDIAIDENDLNDDFLQENKGKILEMIEDHMAQLYSTPPASPEQKRSQSRDTVQAAISRETTMPSPASSFALMLPPDSPLCSGRKISSSLEPNPRSNFSDENGPASSHRFKTPGTKG